MIKYLIPIAFLGSSAMAHPIETRINASFHKIVHSTLYARAAGTDKPPVLVFDGTLPRTEQNKGVLQNLEAWDLTAKILQTEGPIQILYHDYMTNLPVECGKGIYQEKGSEKLIRIYVDMTFSLNGINCTATGEYEEKTAEEMKDDSSHIAHLKKRW